MSDNAFGSDPEISRRTVLKALGLGGIALGTGVPILSGCGLKKSSSPSGAALKIGYVSPQTGALASFALADNFVVQQMNTIFTKGIKAGGKTRSVQIIVKDSQSDSNRASAVARELIFNDKVDIVVSSSTPDVTNPVADQCEANGMPNVATIVPWEAWFFGRGKKHAESFQYSTMFFFGMQQFVDCFVPMWDKMNVTSKRVDCLWPNDVDANAFRAGLGDGMKKRGYTPNDAGAYQDGISDFSAELSKFKNSGAELFTCTPIPPDFQTFWKQAAQQGYKPKLATVAKVMLFPSEVEALGQLSNNVATDIWWSPSHPYKSALDGSTAQTLADNFSKSTGKQWTQALGSIYSLFEIAHQAFTTAADPQDKKAVASALKSMKIDCMSGTLDFTAGPEAGIAIQKPVGGQWRPGKKFPWDVSIVDNTANPAVATTGDLQPTNA
jgi:branched-chain amino acid transport system substrate-binding protein